MNVHIMCILNGVTHSYTNFTKSMVVYIGNILQVRTK